MIWYRNIVPIYKNYIIIITLKHINVKTCNVYEYMQQVWIVVNLPYTVK